MPKSGKPREIPLGDEVRAALKAHRRGPLARCTMAGNDLTTVATRGPLWTACKRAGLPALDSTEAGVRRHGWRVLNGGKG